MEFPCLSSNCSTWRLARHAVIKKLAPASPLLLIELMGQSQFSGESGHLQIHALGLMFSACILLHMNVYQAGLPICVMNKC